MDALPGDFLFKLLREARGVASTAGTIVCPTSVVVAASGEVGASAAGAVGDDRATTSICVLG